MSLRETIKEMRELLNNITTDLEKAEGGNKAASQRVRTGTVHLEKTAKKYRKESIEAEKQPKAPKKAGANAGKSMAAAKPKAKPAVKTAVMANAAAAKAKPKTAIAKARPRPLAVQKRPTAKLPSKLAFR